MEIAQSLTDSYRAPHSAGRVRETFLRLLLVLVASGVGLSFSEIIMRVFHVGHIRRVLVYNNKIRKLAPHFRFMNYENNNLVETNNLGFHDRERQATNDNYRILFLGDSFLAGEQVPTESLFTIRMEDKFTQEGQKIETINAGVPSTGTAYQYVLWKEFFEPNIRVDHLVLCFFMGNDLVDNNRDLTSTIIGGSDTFVDSQGNILAADREPGLARNIINHLRDHSVLVNTAYERVSYMREVLREESEDVGGDAGVPVDKSGAWEASEQGTIALITRWKSELARKNMPFDIVVIDRPGKVYNRFELEFIDKLQATCTREHIDCLRLKLTTDPYETYSFDGIGLGHFNYRGHELAANELYDFFKSRHAAIFNRSTR